MGGGCSDEDAQPRSPIEGDVCKGMASGNFAKSSTPVRIDGGPIPHIDHAVEQSIGTFKSGDPT
jgi:hypothetical protein